MIRCGFCPFPACCSFFPSLKANKQEMENTLSVLKFIHLPTFIVKSSLLPTAWFDEHWVELLYKLKNATREESTPRACGFWYLTCLRWKRLLIEMRINFLSINVIYWSFALAQVRSWLHVSVSGGEETVGVDLGKAISESPERFLKLVLDFLPFPTTSFSLVMWGFCLGWAVQWQDRKSWAWYSHCMHAHVDLSRLWSECLDGAVSPATGLGVAQWKCTCLGVRPLAPFPAAQKQTRIYVLLMWHT